jgi:hypothetical protein
MATWKFQSVSFGIALCSTLTAALGGEFWVPGGPPSPPIIRIDSDSGQFLGNGASMQAEDFSDMTAGPNGLVYATGMGVGIGTVNRFRHDGTFLDVLVPLDAGGPYGSGDGHESRASIGGDGFLYVSSFKIGPSQITGLLKYDAQTGAYLGSVSGYGSGEIKDVESDALGRLYVASATGIRRHDFGTGSWTDFAAGAVGAMEFGPDQKLYLLTGDSVRRYELDGTSLGEFIPPISGRTNLADLTFGPTGDIFVTKGESGQVFRYSGQTGADLGLFASVAGGHAATMSIIYVPEPSAALICVGLSLLCRRRLGGDRRRQSMSPRNPRRDNGPAGRDGPCASNAARRPASHDEADS